MIVVAGMISADILVGPVKEFPAHGTLEQVGLVDVKLGGCVGNTGAALAKLGIPVTAISRLGQDDWAEIIRREVSRWADCYDMPVDQRDRSPATVVFIHPDGTRSFLHAPGALRQFCLDDLYIRNMLSRDVKAIHIGYALLMPKFDGAPLEAVLRAFSAGGRLTSLDVAWHPAADWRQIERLLPYVDLFCPNYEEAQAITGQSRLSRIAERLLDMGVRQAVAIKRGEQGAYLKERGAGPLYIDPYHTGSVVDSTGAGDAFIAGMLSGWYRGMKWSTAARVASVAGGMSVNGSGAGAGLPNWSEIEKRLHEVKVEDDGGN